MFNILGVTKSDYKDLRGFQSLSLKVNRSKNFEIARVEIEMSLGRVVNFHCSLNLEKEILS
ncbi:hypothetical protein CM19_04645 [Candidatus Acidianus copahuensis]|uniref:Uncharacterized protein n=1 Tax=Candidatus Acidianus copahuensis TaxID=1160895 RepID=A0A031LSD9_9CREN|nr:hypothetical protein CM19_04645 [Candidatus Acidianus copahuensis]